MCVQLPGIGERVLPWKLQGSCDEFSLRNQVYPQSSQYGVMGVGGSACPPWSVNININSFVHLKCFQESSVIHFKQSKMSYSHRVVDLLPFLGVYFKTWQHIHIESTVFNSFINWGEWIPASPEHSLHCAGHRWEVLLSSLSPWFCLLLPAHGMGQILLGRGGSVLHSRCVPFPCRWCSTIPAGGELATGTASSGSSTWPRGTTWQPRYVGLGWHLCLPLHRVLFLWHLLRICHFPP